MGATRAGVRISSMSEVPWSSPGGPSANTVSSPAIASAYRLPDASSRSSTSSLSAPSAGFSLAIRVSISSSRRWAAGSGSGPMPGNSCPNRSSRRWLSGPRFASSVASASVIAPGRRFASYRATSRWPISCRSPSAPISPAWTDGAPPARSAFIRPASRRMPAVSATTRSPRVPISDPPTAYRRRGSLRIWNSRLTGPSYGVAPARRPDPGDRSHCPLRRSPPPRVGWSRRARPRGAGAPARTDRSRTSTAGSVPAARRSDRGPR